MWVLFTCVFCLLGMLGFCYDCFDFVWDYVGGIIYLVFYCLRLFVVVILYSLCFQLLCYWLLCWFEFLFELIWCYYLAVDWITWLIVLVTYLDEWSLLIVLVFSVWICGVWVCVVFYVLLKFGVVCLVVLVLVYFMCFIVIVCLGYLLVMRYYLLSRLFNRLF